MAFFRHNEYRKRNLYPTLKYSKVQCDEYEDYVSMLTEMVYDCIPDEVNTEPEGIPFADLYGYRKPKVRTIEQMHEIDRLLNEISQSSNSSDEPHCSKRSAEKKEENQKKSKEEDRIHMQIFHNTLWNVQTFGNGGYLENPEVFNNEILFQYDLISIGSLKCVAAYRREKHVDKTNKNVRKRNTNPFEVLDNDENSEPLTKIAQQQNENEQEIESEVRILGRYEKSNENKNNDNSDESESEDEYEKVEKPNANKRITHSFSEAEVQALQSYAQDYSKKKESLYLSRTERKPAYQMWEWNRQDLVCILSDDNFY